MRMNLRFLVAVSVSAVAVGLVPDLAFGQDDAILAAPCQNITLSPLNRSFTSEGGSAFINVNHENGCSFTATSTDSWIKITSVVVGDDIGTVYYTVAPNWGGTAHAGAITVGPRSFPVYQIDELVRKAPSIIWARSAHSGSVNSLAFSPDNQFLSAGSDTIDQQGQCTDCTLKTWRLSDGALLQTIDGNNNGIISIAFSPDQKVIVAGSGDRVYDGVVRFWRVSDGVLLRFFNQDPNNVYSYVTGVAYSPNGSLFAFGRADGHVVVARNPFATPKPTPTPPSPWTRRR